ncbi:MAG: EamA family transporter [Eubacterium sp.]|nr:EamA family transporter [Eubacterium sp.]
MMKKTGTIFVLLAGILWGFLGIFARVLNKYGLEAMQVVMVRAAVAAAVLFLILLIRDKSLLRIRLRDLWCFLGTGICSIVFFNYCYFTAVSIMSLAAAAVLLYTAPAIVMVLSVLLFGEKITLRKWIAIACTFAGCLLVTGIVGSSVRLSVGGILVGLGAGIGYALYSIFGRYALNKGYSSFTITFYTFLIAAIVSSVMVGGWSPAVSAIKKGGGPVVLSMLALGVLSTVLAFLFYTIGLTKMESSYASVVASIEPVTASILGVVLYHEKLSAWTIAGIALVLGAILIVNINQPK